MKEEASDSNLETQELHSYWLGQELDWEAGLVPVVLFVELPYWLLVPECPTKIELHGHTFNVEIRGWLHKFYVQTGIEIPPLCVHIGPDLSKLDQELKEAIDEQNLPLFGQKCKTVLRIHTRCNEDVILATGEEGRRVEEAHMYLAAFCEAHIEVVNSLVQSYRLSTYDLFAYEVTPWDIPAWFVELEKGFIQVQPVQYLTWHHKPLIVAPDGAEEVHKLITSDELQAGVALEPNAGELELLDAINFMERGNYSDAVRRVTTAIEAIVQSVLRIELLKKYPEPEVEERLCRSRNDFPGRSKQYQKLSGRKLPSSLDDELTATRDLRHSIVHRASRISFNDRGRAQRAVDTGRWIYNWFENDPARSDVREKRILRRMLGRHHSLFDTEIDSLGVVVHKPPSMD